MNAKRKIVLDDLYSLSHIEDPQVSPDQKWLAFVRVSIDRAENTYASNIWIKSLIDLDRAALQLTRSGKDSYPRWSPDSRDLSFTSARGDQSQVYILRIAEPGGESRKITNLSNGANGGEWSPDGSQLSFVSPLNRAERMEDPDAVKLTDPTSLGSLERKHLREREEKEEKDRLDPYYMHRIPYRAGTRFLGDRYAQIHVVDIMDSANGDLPSPRRLTNVDVDHAPGQWTPDGAYLLTSRALDPAVDEPFRSMGIFRVSIADGEGEALTDETHTCHSPRVSPDGLAIAFTRSPSASPTESIVRLAFMQADGSGVQDLNVELDRSPVACEWSRDGGSIIAIIESWGQSALYRFDLEQGYSELLNEQLSMELLAVADDGRIAFSASSPINPGELYLTNADTDGYEALTGFNLAWLDALTLQEPQEIRFTNSSGQTIQGWYLLPDGYKDGDKYPLALNIHGGPHVMWSPSTRSMFMEWQLHAAQGYVAFYCNPRGGDGYGEAFRRSLHGAWGEVAYEDIMAGVDALIEKGIIDEGRMAITGGSYGGYMTAWTIGHTDRFAAAVAQRGVYNLASFYGTSDIPSLISYEFDVTPWEDIDLLWKHSPLAYANKIDTPLLIVHAENDYRVPIEQAEQLFAYVHRSGGEVEMWRYPRDGHELSRSGEPPHRVSRLEKMLEWFDRYCK